MSTAKVLEQGGDTFEILGHVASKTASVRVLVRVRVYLYVYVYV